MSERNEETWTPLERQACFFVAARLAAGQRVDPLQVAQQILGFASIGDSPQELARLAAFIRREIPQLELRIKRLKRGRTP